MDRHAPWILAAVAFASGTAAMAEPESRARFVARHRCEVVARLEAIHRHRDTSRDRFIVLAVRDSPNRYVQCMFEDHDSRMLCEAASGAYGPAGAARLHLDAEALTALQALRYSQTDPHGNFAQVVALGSPPDVGIAADLMLTALHDAYGARPGTPLQIDAPLGGDPEPVCGTPAT